MKEKEKMRKVDKAQFLNEISMATNKFKHREDAHEDIQMLRDEADGKNS